MLHEGGPHLACHWPWAVRAPLRQPPEAPHVPAGAPPALAGGAPRPSPVSSGRSLGTPHPTAAVQASHKNPPEASDAGLLLGLLCLLCLGSLHRSQKSLAY